MTLGELLRKLRAVGDQFNTYEIPLITDGWDDVEFEVKTVQDASDGKYYVQIVQIIKYEKFTDDDLKRFRRSRNDNLRDIL